MTIFIEKDTDDTSLIQQLINAHVEIERLRGDIETLQAELRYERRTRRALEPKP